MIAFWIPPPRTPATARANTSPGKARNRSEIRIRTVSALPPFQPQKIPIAVPTTVINQEQRCINTGRTSYDHTGKHISSITVCPEQMLRSRRFLGKCQILGIRIIRAEIFCKCRYKQKQCCKHKKKDKLCFCMIFPDLLLPDCDIIFSTHALSPPSRTLGSR